MPKFSGEVLHFNTVKMRITGSGNLLLNLRSLDNINVSSLTSIPMVSLTNREPVVLSNFVDQHAQLEMRTTEINETFSISKIILFIRPIATLYPQ